MSLSQSLCLACGLCCDGTLFSSVPLRPNDELGALKTAGVSIVSDGDPNMFTQPCAAHKNCACIIYANRPHDCRAYKCELLKRFERDEISHESALEIINKIISLKNEVNALALAASTDMQSKEDVTLLMKRWWKNPSVGATEQEYAHIFLKFGALQIYLDRFFRKKLIAKTVASHSSEPALASTTSPN